MKPVWPLLICSFALTACASPRAVPVPVPVTEYKVVIPSKDFFRCPQVDLPEDTSKLTEFEVADILFKYENANQTCKKNMKKIEQFLNTRKKEIEKIK